MVYLTRSCIKASAGKRLISIVSFVSRQQLEKAAVIESLPSKRTFHWHDPGCGAG